MSRFTEREEFWLLTKVVKGGGGGGLPEGYTQLTYVSGSGSGYIPTGVYLASTDIVEAEFANSSSTGYGALYGSYKMGESSALYGNQTYYGYDVANNKVDTNIAVDTSWHKAQHDFASGRLVIDGVVTEFTPFEFENTDENYLLARYYNKSYGYYWKGSIRKYKVYRNGTLISNLVPAQHGEDIGMYDLVRNEFLVGTNITAGDPV